MTRVCEEGIQNEHVRRMFYYIPCICNMIAARQLDFIGKTVHGPSDRPAQQMLTASCDTVCQFGCPFLHTKDYIVENLSLLFANVPEVTIDKIWLPQALDKGIITQAVLESIGRVPYQQTCYHSCPP